MFRSDIFDDVAGRKRQERVASPAGRGADGGSKAAFPDSLESHLAAPDCAYLAFDIVVRAIRPGRILSEGAGG